MGETYTNFEITAYSSTGKRVTFVVRNPADAAPYSLPGNGTKFYDAAMAFTDLDLVLASLQDTDE